MDKNRMIFVQIYIKILRFGQKSILMKVELFEIFLSENSEIYLFFDISLVFGIFLELLRHIKIQLHSSPILAFIAALTSAE